MHPRSPCMPGCHQLARRKIYHVNLCPHLEYKVLFPTSHSSHPKGAVRIVRPRGLDRRLCARGPTIRAVRKGCAIECDHSRGRRAGASLVVEGAPQRASRDAGEIRIAAAENRRARDASHPNPAASKERQTWTARRRGVPRHPFLSTAPKRRNAEVRLMHGGRNE